MFRLLKINRILNIFLIISTLLIFLEIIYYSDAFPIYWRGNVLGDFLAWTACCLLVAWLVGRNFKLMARPFYLLLLTFYFAVGVGLEESLTVILFLFSSVILGNFFLGIIFPRKNIINHDLDNYFIIGLVVQLAIFGALIHFKFNYRILYLIILITPVIIIFIQGRLINFWRYFLNKLSVNISVFNSIPYWNFILMVTLIGFVARYSFFPTIGYDDNALHLGMWTQLTYQHIYSFDVVSQIWAVAPFAVDILHSIVSLVAGDDARGALNIILLFLLFRQIWLISAHFLLTPSDRFLVILLLASTPMLGNLLVTLQTELFLAFLSASGVRVLLDSRSGLHSESNVVVLAIAAMCCATKLPGALLGVLMMSAGIAITWFRRGADGMHQTYINRVLLIFLILIITFVAFNSYLTAWRITENPVFPLYNGFFKSIYFNSENFSDLRYVTGFSINSYWNVFFKTSKYFESRDFVAGFQYLFLFPIALIVMLWNVTLKNKVVVLLPLLGFGLVMFSATQYWRYMFPILPLATVVIGHLLIPRDRVVALTARFAIGACIAFNFYFYPGISWFFVVEPQRAYTINGRQEITKEFAPAKVLTTYLNERYASQSVRVLYSSDPFGASLRGDPIYGTWYSPSRQSRLNTIRRIEDVATFLKDEKIGFVVWDMSDSSMPNDPMWMLREHLSQFGLPEFQVGNYILYRVFEQDLSYREVFNSNEESHSQKYFLAKIKPNIIANVKTDGAHVARYHVDYKCKEPKGFFVAQINWNVGSPYYRSVRCNDDLTRFSESIPIPLNATQGDIYITALDIPEVSVSKITLEIY